MIGGYTEPRGARVGFGALLIGFHDGDELRYAGKVGTGYDEATLIELGRRLASLERSTHPPPSRAAFDEGRHWFPRVSWPRWPHQ